MALVEVTSDSLASEQLMVPVAQSMDSAAALMPIVRLIEAVSLLLAFASRLEVVNKWRARKFMFSVWLRQSGRLVLESAFRYPFSF
jgi:hypothetical protein